MILYATFRTVDLYRFFVPIDLKAGTTAVPVLITIVVHSEIITDTYVENRQSITALFTKEDPFCTHLYVKKYCMLPKFREVTF